MDLIANARSVDHYKDNSFASVLNCRTCIYVSLSFGGETRGYDLITFSRNKLHLKLYYYHPPTNLPEGNIFSHVCPSF